MMIKLTNASPQYNGQTVAINSDNIVTMFEDRLMLGNNIEFTVTNVFVPPHGTWQVKERLEDICRILAGDPKQHLLEPHLPVESPQTTK